MIGLGSNRLSVCRRGGMSVTQAGRGGMEWLAGGRGVSPYSAQATAALKAQFQTQWPTIRDYGFAHPEIVGYMNAYAPEDAKIAYSLVEGIGTRWCKSDGNQYLELDYYHNGKTQVNAHLKINQLASQTFLFGAASNSNYGSCFTVYMYSNGSIAWNSHNGSGGWYESSSIKFDLLEHDLYFKAGDRIIVSDLLNSTNGIGTITTPCTRKFRVFWDNGDGHHQKVKMQLTKFIISEDGNSVVGLYPFTRSGVFGMIDVVNNKFYANAGTGTFTELIESPAS